MNETPPFPKLPPLDDLLKRARSTQPNTTPEPLRQVQLPQPAVMPPLFQTEPRVVESEYRFISTNVAISHHLRTINPRIKFGEVLLKFEERTRPYGDFGFHKYCVPLVHGITGGDTSLSIIAFVEDRYAQALSLEFAEKLSDYPYRQVIGLNIYDPGRGFPYHIKDIITKL